MSHGPTNLPRFRSQKRRLANFPQQKTTQAGQRILQRHFTITLTDVQLHNRTVCRWQHPLQLPKIRIQPILKAPDIYTNIYRPWPAEDQRSTYHFISIWLLTWVNRLWLRFWLVSRPTLSPHRVKATLMRDSTLTRVPELCVKSFASYFFLGSLHVQAVDLACLIVDYGMLRIRQKSFC